MRRIYTKIGIFYLKSAYFIKNRHNILKIGKIRFFFIWPVTGWTNKGYSVGWRSSNSKPKTGPVELTTSFLDDSEIRSSEVSKSSSKMEPIEEQYYH